MQRINSIRDALSKRDAILLLELTQKSLYCKSQEDLKKLIRNFEDLISSARAISVFVQKSANGLIESHNPLNIDYPDGYVAEYVKRNFMETDPVFVENFKSYKLQFWADTRNIHPTPKKIFDLALDFGFTKAPRGHGYTIGVGNLKGTEGSLFSFYGLNRDKRTEVILNLIVPHFHEALARIINIPRNTAALSSKEVEVLKWMAEGKCSWAIAKILKISDNTVNFHIKNIKNKLDALNKTHAVAIAVRKKLIEIE